MKMKMKSNVRVRVCHIRKKRQHQMSRLEREQPTSKKSSAV